jgi:chromosome segregation ATPase
VEPPQDDVELSGERGELLAEVQRLEAELERYRTHAERTSKLFLSATNYAEWVRESARHDAELALRKARAKVEQLEATAGELERTERELARLQGELEGLQALTDEARARLSAFVAAGLQALNTEEAAGQGDGPKPALGDLQDTLQGQLASNSASTPGRLREGDRPER